MPSRFKRIWAQCTKDLIQLWRDPFSILLVILMPLVTILIYGFAIRILITEVPLVVQDFDQSALSRAYIERLEATNRFKVTSLALQPSEKYFSSEPKSDPTLDALDRGIAKAVLVIPPDFSRDIKEGKLSKVQVLLDGTDVNNTRAIRSTIRAATNFFLSRIGLQPSGSRVAVQSRLWSNLGGKESRFIVPGVYALVLWVYPGLFAALSMAREKEQGTLLQVYLANMSAVELLMGKGLAYFLVGICQTVLVMDLGSLLFGLRLVGDPIPLLVGTSVFLMSSTIFGLFIGTQANSRIVAVQGFTLLGYLTSSFLTGIYHPLRNIPFPLSLISNLLPVRYYVELSRDAFVRGAGWTAVWFVNLAIALLGLLLFNTACKALRRMQLPD